MKRLTTLVALLLSAGMMLNLASCGEDEDSKPRKKAKTETTVETTVSQTEIETKKETEPETEDDIDTRLYDDEKVLCKYDDLCYSTTGERFFDDPWKCFLFKNENSRPVAGLRVTASSGSPLNSQKPVDIDTDTNSLQYRSIRSFSSVGHMEPKRTDKYVYTLAIFEQGVDDDFYKIIKNTSSTEYQPISNDYKYTKHYLQTLDDVIDLPFKALDMEITDKAKIKEYADRADFNNISEADRDLCKTYNYFPVDGAGDLDNIFVRKCYYYPYLGDFESPGLDEEHIDTAFTVTYVYSIPVGDPTQSRNVFDQLCLNPCVAPIGCKGHFNQFFQVLDISCPELDELELKH